MPPLPEMKGATGRDRILDSENDLLGLGMAQLHPSFVARTKAIKAIVASSGVAQVVAQDSAPAMAGLGFAGCTKTAPDLHWFNPLNRTGRKRQTQLQHVVGSTGTLKSSFRTIAVNACPCFAEKPLALIPELQAQLIGMHMGRQVRRTGHAALEGKLPTVTRAEECPTSGRQVSHNRWRRKCGVDSQSCRCWFCGHPLQQATAQG